STPMLKRHRHNSAKQRKSINYETASPSILVASGEVSVSDKQLLTQLLGRFGLTAEFMKPDEYEARIKKLGSVIVPNHESVPEKYDITSIKNPTDFIVREHVEHYQRLAEPNNKRAGYIFNYLVDGKLN